jgi:hypothetical protein
MTGAFHQYVRLTWAAFDKAPASLGGARPVVGQGSARSGDKAPTSPAVVRRRDKLKIRPEFPILNRPICKHSVPHATTKAGRQRRRENGRTSQNSRSRHTVVRQTSEDQCPKTLSLTMSEVLRRAQASGGLGLGRGGQTYSGCQARGLTVSEAHRRVPASCPFLSGGRHAPIRAPTTTLVISRRRLKPCRPLIRPTHSGFTPLRLRDLGSERSEMPLPTGLAVSRGQFRSG